MPDQSATIRKWLVALAQVAAAVAAVLAVVVAIRSSSSPPPAQGGAAETRLSQGVNDSEAKKHAKEEAERVNKERLLAEAEDEANTLWDTVAEMRRVVKELDEEEERYRSSLKGWDRHLRKAKDLAEQAKSNRDRHNVLKKEFEIERRAGGHYELLAEQSLKRITELSKKLTKMLQLPSIPALQALVASSDLDKYENQQRIWRVLDRYGNALRVGQQVQARCRKVPAGPGAPVPGTT